MKQANGVEERAKDQLQSIKVCVENGRVSSIDVSTLVVTQAQAENAV